VLRRLHQHDPSRSLTQRLGRQLRRLYKRPQRDFSFLRDPRKLNDWHHRFEAAGSQDASAAWNRILTKELDPEEGDTTPTRKIKRKHLYQMFRDLVEGMGGKVVEISFLIELTFLKGRERLKGRQVFSLIEF